MDENFVKAKKYEFEKRKPHSVDEVNEYLLNNRPDLHSTILKHAAHSTRPGLIISLAYSSVYIIIESQKQNNNQTPKRGR